jgi:hypothetical protein
VKANAPTRAGSDPAEFAIAKVLRAEREAREAIEHAQLEAQRIAEQSRADARALAERTERRIRSIAGAFEQQLSRELAEIDAEAAGMTRPHVLGESELARLHEAVRKLALQLVGAAR